MVDTQQERTKDRPPGLLVCIGDRFGGRGIKAACHATCGAEIAHDVRQLVWDREVIVYLHRQALEHFGLTIDNAKAFFTGGEQRGSTWIYRDGPTKVLIVVVPWTGDFADCNPNELWRAVELLAGAVAPYRFSAPSMIHDLILAHGGWIPRSEPEPVLSDGGLPVWIPPAYATPAHAWQRPLTEAETDAGWWQAFDRRGSYLAVWPNMHCSMGPWARLDAHEVGPNPRQKPGYWLLGEAVVDKVRAFTAAAGCPDILARQGDPAGSMWITTPLLCLIIDLIGPIPVDTAWTTKKRVPRLRAPQERLVAARRLFAAAGHDDLLAVLKVGYAGGLSWFEHAKEVPHPLARPHWARTIRDQHVTNVYRSLAQTWPAPFLLTAVDTAVFAVEGPESVPEGLRTDPSRLGTWKPKGRPVKASEGRRALKRGAGELIKLIEAAP